MSREEKILYCIDPKTELGIEIGPLFRPIVKKSDGNIKYVDFTTTEVLKKNYKNNPNIPINEIVDVDYVWGNKTLRDAIGGNIQFDYVIASHVVEHIPDIISWLKEIFEILKPNGKLSLVIPDKRYTFDCRRQESTCGDLLDAYIRKLRKPSIKQIYDHFANHVSVNIEQAWSEKFNPNNIQLMHDESYAWQIAYSAYKNNKYEDSHCYVFTPTSFINILKSLIKMNLLSYKIISFFSTEINTFEFFLTLEKTSNTNKEEILNRLSTLLKKIQEK